MSNGTGVEHCDIQLSKKANTMQDVRLQKLYSYILTEEFLDTILLMKMAAREIKVLREMNQELEAKYAHALSS